MLKSVDIMVGQKVECRLHETKMIEVNSMKFGCRQISLLFDFLFLQFVITFLAELSHLKHLFCCGNCYS